MSAYFKHTGVTKEMKDIWKKNGKLSDYKPKKRNNTDDRGTLDFINSKFL